MCYWICSIQTASTCCICERYLHGEETSLPVIALFRQEWPKLLYGLSSPLTKPCMLALFQQLITAALVGAESNTCCTYIPTDCCICCSGLHFTAAIGNAECTRMLCEAGADIDLGDKQGDHAAITCGHSAPNNCAMKCIALLLT